MNKNELMEINDNTDIFGLGDKKNDVFERDFVGELTSRETTFCSLEGKDQTSKIALFNAMNTPDHHMSDCINEVIYATDLFLEKVTCKRDDGGVDVCPRIVLIDKDGKSYQSVSMGVFSALRKLIVVFGQPHWEKPLPLKIKQIKKDKNSILTFELVPEKTK